MTICRQGTSFGSNDGRLYDYALSRKPDMGAELGNLAITAMFRRKRPVWIPAALPSGILIGRIVV